ncbi:MAG: SPOR domain-containing protein [Gammaproteobacteria bacterium]
MGKSLLAAIAVVVSMSAVRMADAAPPPATVHLLQAPAWLERAGGRQALRPGSVLQNGDRIVTGAGARVVLALAEGSLVKLGATATLALDDLVVPPDEAGLFRGFLDVVRGAFRFTTTLAGRQRDVRARVRTATIGIRGTDVWGKSETTRDFVVLLEGAITVTRDGQEQTLDQPLSLFMAPRDRPVLPITTVATADLARWAQETEPQAGQGIVGGDGGFVLHLAEFAHLTDAQRLVTSLDAVGYAATVVPKGEGLHRVSITGYASQADAVHDGAQLVRQQGLPAPRVGRGD